VVDTYAAPSQDTALTGLLTGLQQFNPALQQYVDLKNPNATQDQTDQYITGRVRSNFVYDQANRINVQVPEGQASDAAKDAVDSYIAQAREKYGVHDGPRVISRAVGNVLGAPAEPPQSVGLIYGKDGNYQLSMLMNGVPIHKLEDVTFDRIMQQAPQSACAECLRQRAATRAAFVNEKGS
jgi:hypothetical protein